MITRDDKRLINIKEYAESIIESINTFEPMDDNEDLVDTLDGIDSDLESIKIIRNDLALDSDIDYDLLQNKWEEKHPNQPTDF